MSSVELLIRQGDNLFQEGKFKEAAVCYEQAMQVDSADPIPHLRRAIVYSSEGDLEKTTECIQNALRFDPMLAGARELMTVTEKRKIVRALVEEGGHGDVSFTNELLNTVDEQFFAALRLEAMYLRYVGNIRAAYWLDYDVAPMLTKTQIMMGMLKPLSFNRKPVLSHTNLALEALGNAQSIDDVRNAVKWYPFMTEAAFIQWTEQVTKETLIKSTLLKRPLEWLRQVAQEK